MEPSRFDRQVSKTVMHHDCNGGLKGRAMVILGMHRSGTSALARSISFCGYALPQDVMPARTDNPKGFWEPLAVARLNNAILAGFGLSWDRPGPLLCAGMNLAESRQAVADASLRMWLTQAASALRSSFGDASAIVLKDPRITLLLPLWMRAIEETGYAARCVLIYRNPLEVAASLNKRNLMPVRRAMQLWLHYNLCCLRDLGFSGMLGGVISFHSLLDNPVSTTADAIGANTADHLSEEIEAQISGYIASGDNHFPKTAASLIEAPHIATAIKDLWHLLEKWAESTFETRLRCIEKIGAVYDEAMLLSGQIVRPRIP